MWYEDWYCERDCPRGKWCASRSRGLPCSVYYELRKEQENAKNYVHATNGIQSNNRNDKRLSKNALRTRTKKA